MATALLLGDFTTKNTLEHTDSLDAVATNQRNCSAVATNQRDRSAVATNPKDCIHAVATNQNDRIDAVATSQTDRLAVAINQKAQIGVKSVAQSCG